MMHEPKREQSAGCEKSEKLEIKHRSLEKPNKKNTKKSKKQKKNFSHIKKFAGKIKIKICSVKPFVKSHKDGFRCVGIAVLSIAIILQSGFLWTKMLDRSSTPKGTFAHTAVRWLEHTNKSSSDVIEPAAYPIKLAVRTQLGLYGIQYSADGVKTAWEQTEDIWGQALSAVHKIQYSSKTQYSDALENPMMFVEFDGSVPLRLIAGWTGADISDSTDYISCGGMLLSREDKDSYKLYFRDSATQLIYCAYTSLKDTDFDTAASGFAANGCTLAADTQTLVFPDTLQFSQPQSFDTVMIQPYSGSMSGLLEALDMDGQSAQETAYSTKDGTVVYVGDGTSVRVTPSGVMSYTAENGIEAYTGRLNRAGREQKCAQLGYTIASDILDAMGSGGQAYLTKAYTDKNGRYVTVFSMYIDGVPVDNELGYFMRFEFDGGELMHADAVLRTFTVTGTAVTVMPEKIAAAARNDGTALLSLRYTDSVSILSDEKKREGTYSRSASDGYDRADDSWVDAASTYSSGTSADGTVPNTVGTANSNLYSNSQYGTSYGAVSSGTGQSVSASAKWKFILYQAVETQNLGSGTEFDGQDTPDFTICHMPDFLTPISGGADK